MNNISYSRAPDISAAVSEIASDKKAKLIAGGTNLLDLMKLHVEQPNHLVDINHIAFDKIEETEEGGLRLGALVTNADTAYHPLVEERYPLLSKAILSGASAQLRNMATNGGNLMQRTRCYYFYDKATACNKREPGAGCAAIHGFNRIHAILGASKECIATHPSDMCVALAALEAMVNVTGKKGDRIIPFAEFHRLPGNTPQADNSLQPDEVITSIDLPARGFANHHTYIKIRDRASYAFALVSVAAALEMEGNIIQEARLALGGVAHKPWREPEAEELLKGKTASRERFQEVAEFMLLNAFGYEHNSFKIGLAKRAIVRALMEATKTEESL
jgi:xanthine dehydrogenase YagS FAD-binding subunit